MESVAMGNCPLNVDENQDVKASQSAENFQKFMYELFEKNGVMNDLRSYLRGHIVNVLRSAQTGDPPSCQKHFTQRLELTFQALNILIAEYLLRLEFSYTLSVFVSEIPLANMVFSFAKSLMKKVDNDDSRPRFKDSDVWCILNYLGVKCDSVHASNIVEMYRLERNSPLLLCILQTAPLFKEPIVIEQVHSSQDSLSSSQKSSGSEKPGSPSKPSLQEKCRHYVFCKTCQSKMMRVKEKYKRRKKEIAKNLKETSLNSLNVDSLMKNISSMERSLIDEMFDQLKSVYEAEMELLKQEEDRRVKRSLVSHTTQLQKRREEMEESFKAREAELESNVQQKKRFLWGLARALREQNQHMTRAMQDVRAETTRLTDKEESLKAQLAEAEKVLGQRGEDMRRQITEELTILEGHLESMKRERDNINRERAQLERYKDRSEQHIESEDLKPHYDLLKNELTILKKYLETAKLQPKCVIERGTITDICDVTYVTSDVTTRDVTTRDDVMSRDDVTLNNEQDVRARGKPKQLVNDLKKPKNVNFSQSNLDEVYRERSRSRSRSSASSEAGDAQFLAERDSRQALREENEQLRCFARQQRQHIDSLSLQQARLQAELTAARATAPSAPTAPIAFPLPPPLRPRTAPTVAAYTLDAHNQRLSASASVNHFSFGWRKGAGEELSLFSHARPGVVLPGEHVPFIGRHTDNRRYLINQWRTLRRRMSPLSGGITKTRVTSTLQRNLDRPDIAGPSVRLHLDQIEDVTQPTPAGYRPPERPREKSPKSVLREAKENLRNNEAKDHPPTKREKSPNCVLREAKMRLRKLEIEAEAVEKSYLDFRRKQDSFRGEIDKKDTINIEAKPSTSTYKLDEKYTKESTSRYQAPINDYDKYFKEYQTKVNISDHFKNKNTAAEILKPIPNAFSTQKPKTDYIETPLTEFRKYYQTERFLNETINANQDTSKKGTRKELIRQAKHDKIKELELLKHNIGKIYNMPEQAIVETPPTNEENNEIESKYSKETIEQNSVENTAVETISNADNILRIEVESVSEINDLKPTESQDLLLIVESSVDNNRDTDIENDKEMAANQMTIIISPKSVSPTLAKSEIINPKAETISEKSEIITQRNESITESLISPRKASIKSSKKGSITSERIDISPRRNPNYGSKSEKYDHMTTDDVVAFYHSDNDRSSVQMTLEISKEVVDNTISELEQNEDPDYPDDFSADVDNYNSRSDYENNSPISLPKTSEDENFWDS